MAQIIRMGNPTKRAILFKCSCGCEFKEEYNVCKHYTIHEKFIQPAINEQDEWDKCNGLTPWYKDVSTDMHSTTCPCCHKTVEVTDEHYSQQCHYEYEEECAADPDAAARKEITRYVLDLVDYEGRDTSRLDHFLTRTEGHAGENEMRWKMHKYKMSVESIIGRKYKYDISFDFTKPEYLTLAVECFELLFPTRFPRTEEYMRSRQVFVRDFIERANNPKSSCGWQYWQYERVLNGDFSGTTDRTKQLWEQFRKYKSEIWGAVFYNDKEEEMLKRFMCVSNSLSVLVDNFGLTFDKVIEYIYFNSHDCAYRTGRDYNELTEGERAAEEAKAKEREARTAAKRAVIEKCLAKNANE